MKQQIKKYQSWCVKNGYKSSDTEVLLWYFNRKDKVIKNNGSYEIVINGKHYKPEELIEKFKNHK